jgi:hypothetical protein
MFLLDLRVPAIAEALEEHGGPLDVREEEGDRSGRQGSHGSSARPVRQCILDGLLQRHRPALGRDR